VSLDNFIKRLKCAFDADDAVAFGRVLAGHPELKARIN
jgi:hypothetical protein